MIFKRPHNFVLIVFNIPLPIYFQSIGKKAFYCHWGELWLHQIILTRLIFVVILRKSCDIRSKYRVIACITAVELFDTFSIPILHESVVTVDLQLIGFAVVVLLNLISSVVNIFAVLMRNVLYNDRRRIL